MEEVDSSSFPNTKNYVLRGHVMKQKFSFPDVQYVISLMWPL